MKFEKRELPLVSIIVPTYNSERTIRQCLESIKNQTYPNIEVIVVDGGSTDRTVEIAKSFGAKVIILEGEERSASVNYGVKTARGKYIYRVDSDVVLDPNIVSECVHKCESKGYDALSIMWLPDPAISFWAKVRRLEKECYYETKDINRVAARFMKKEVFEKLGGFRIDLVAGEDYDLQNRLLENGYKVGFAEHVEIHIGEPKSLTDIIRKNYYYGKTLIHFLGKNKVKGFKQVNPIRISLLKNWKKFLKRPLLTLGFLVYYLVLYLSTIVGLIVGILCLKFKNTIIMDRIR